MRRRPRIVVLGFRHVLVALAIGLLLNVCVAWHSAYRFDRDDLTFSAWRDSSWPVGASGREEFMALKPFLNGRYSGFLVGVEFRSIIALDSSSDGGWSMRTRRDGWPWPALARQTLLTHPNEPRWLTATSPTFEYLGSIEVRGRDLPYLPVWRGLIGNTLLFALVALPIVMVPGVIVRWRRVLPGHCAACGYDVTGLAICPECGARAPERVPSPARDA